MKFFRKSRPQQLFESLWVSSFGLLSRIWEASLLIHSKHSVENNSELLDFIEKKSERTFELSHEIFEMSKEVFEVFHKHYPEPYKEDWYKFSQGLTKFQDDLTSLEIRFFLFKDVITQINETHPQWKKLNETFQINYEKFIKLKSLIDELIFETSEATHNAIAITRSIDENISFDEADKRERKRWE